MYSDLNRARSASALCCATARMGKEQMAPARANAGVDLLIGTSMFALRTTQLKGQAPSSFLSERACVLCSRPAQRVGCPAHECERQASPHCNRTAWQFRAIHSSVIVRCEERGSDAGVATRKVQKERDYETTCSSHSS